LHTRGSSSTTHFRPTIDLASSADDHRFHRYGCGGKFDYAVDDVVRETPPLASVRPGRLSKVASPLGVMATNPAGVRKI
jgi:hypothetical protein